MAIVAHIGRRVISLCSTSMGESPCFRFWSQFSLDDIPITDPNDEPNVIQIIKFVILHNNIVTIIQADPHGDIHFCIFDILMEKFMAAMFRNLTLSFSCIPHLMQLFLIFIVIIYPNFGTRFTIS